jgi:hypothetical protein
VVSTDVTKIYEVIKVSLKVSSNTTKNIYRSSKIDEILDTSILDLTRESYFIGDYLIVKYAHRRVHNDMKKSTLLGWAKRMGGFKKENVCSFNSSIDFNSLYLLFVSTLPFYPTLNFQIQKCEKDPKSASQYVCAGVVFAFCASLLSGVDGYVYYVRFIFVMGLTYSTASCYLFQTNEENVPCCI